MNRRVNLATVKYLLLFQPTGYLKFDGNVVYLAPQKVHTK